MNDAYHSILSIAALKAGKVTLEDKLEDAVTKLQSVPKVANLLGPKLSTFRESFRPWVF
jgi:hypothetical protein